MNDLKNSYVDREDIVFLAVASSKIDNDEKIIKFLEKRSFEFIHLSTSTDSNFFQFVGNVSFPTTVVYNKNGKLIFYSKINFEIKENKKD